MASSSNRRAPTFSPPERVFAKLVVNDGLVRFVSTQKFYLEQIKWCVKTVSDYWRHLVRHRNGVWPTEVPMTLRFCISWLTGYNHLDWTAREVCSWLQRNIGLSTEGPNAASIAYVTWAHSGDPDVARLPRSHRPVMLAPLHVPIVDLPPAEVLFRPEPPTVGPQSSVVSDVSEEGSEDAIAGNSDEELAGNIEHEK